MPIDMSVYSACIDDCACICVVCHKHRVKHWGAVAEAGGAGIVLAIPVAVFVLCLLLQCVVFCLYSTVAYVVAI